MYLHLFSPSNQQARRCGSVTLLSMIDDLISSHHSY